MPLLFFPSGAGGSQTIVAVGRATEAELAQALTWSPKHRLAIQATQTDLAQSITEAKHVHVAQAVETETSQAIVSVKRSAVAQATEADSSQALGRVKGLHLGDVPFRTSTGNADFENDLAGWSKNDGGYNSVAITSDCHQGTKALELIRTTPPYTCDAIATTHLLLYSSYYDIELWAKRISGAGLPWIKLFAETYPFDPASQWQKFTLPNCYQISYRDLAIGISDGTADIIVDEIIAKHALHETDSAQVVTPSKHIQVGQAIETDEARETLVRGGELAQVIETDFAQPISAQRVVALGLAAETESARTLTVQRKFTLLQAIEAQDAQAFGKSKTKVIDQALEQELASVVAAARSILLGQSLETDASIRLKNAGGIDLIRADEIDVALPCAWKYRRLSIDDKGRLIAGEEVSWFELESLRDLFVDAEVYQFEA